MVQTPGAPTLSISEVGSQTVISWPASVTGFTLQTNNNLVTGSWGNYSGPVVNNRVTNSATAGALFFSLKH